jgi:hypothetical protein
MRETENVPGVFSVAQVSNRSRPVQPPGRSSLIKADRQKMCYGVQQFAGRHRSQGKIVLLLLCAETPWALSTYDPVEKARQVAEVVCKDGKRKDHRFRPPPFYGFIATADCVGCCLGCAFCWSWRSVASRTLMASSIHLRRLPRSSLVSRAPAFPIIMLRLLGPHKMEINPT